MSGVGSNEIRISIDRSVLIGVGRYSRVYGAVANKDVVVKKIVALDVHPKILSKCSNNLEKMISLDHLNVLKLFDSYTDEYFWYNIIFIYLKFYLFSNPSWIIWIIGSRYFVLERCVATLFDYSCDKYIGNVPQPVDGLYQMASGLNYIHCQGFVHRNVKPENVLISSSIQLKISDFSLTKPISMIRMMSMTSDGRLTSSNMQAPEILKISDGIQQELTDTESEAKHTTSSDIFSLGCLFYNFVTKKGHPFESRGSHLYSPNIVLNIIKGKFDLSGKLHNSIVLP